MFRSLSDDSLSATRDTGSRYALGGLVLSVLGLALVIANWSGLFFYGKVLPPSPWPWLAGWPTLLSPANYACLMCLLPAAVLPRSLRRTTIVLLQACLAAALAAALVYAWQETSDPALLVNAGFNFVWVLLTALLLPALILWLARAGATWLYSRFRKR